MLRPRLLERRAREATLVDVGCGGGDVALRLAQLARRDGVRLRVTGIDPDPRACGFALRARDPRVAFECTTAAELVRRGERFDAVVSNHLLHHLSREELPPFLEATRALAGCVVAHNDIRRSDVALVAFGAFALPFRGSFIREDGLRSVRRAYTQAELERAAHGWVVRRLEPFRLVLTNGR